MLFVHLVNDLKHGRSSFLILYDRVLPLSVIQVALRIGMKIIVMILSMFHKIFSLSVPSIIPDRISLYRMLVLVFLFFVNILSYLECFFPESSLGCKPEKVRACTH